MESPQIIGTDETVHIVGNTAFVVCNEAVDGEPPQLVATNVFIQAGGSWLLIHHHASPIIQVLEEDIPGLEGHNEDPSPSDEIMH